MANAITKEKNFSLGLKTASKNLANKFGFTINENSDTNEPGMATVDLVNTHQVIRGYGAANILPWRPDMSLDQVNKAFGTASGQLGFTILRLRVPPDTSQFAMQVVTAQLAHTLGVKIIASPWTPPALMKTNKTFPLLESIHYWSLHLGF
jgi:O-glycosyl hydrolase